MSRRPSGWGHLVARALALSAACLSLICTAAQADLPSVTVTGGGAADASSGALMLTQAENPDHLGKLPAPVSGQPLFPRRSGGLLQAGLDMGTADGAGVALAPLASTLAAAHLDMARINGYWAYTEPSPDKYDFSTLDAGYKAVIRTGMRPVILLLGSPGWAVGYPGAGRDDGCNGNFCIQPPSPSQYARWGRFTGAVARRYPLAAAIEIWNEPNLWSFWHAGDVDPTAYERVLATAYDSIKAANPAMRVLGGSINGLLATKAPNSSECAALGVPSQTADCRTKHDIGFSDFLTSILKAGAASKMDALSLHPYPVDAANSGITGPFGRAQQILGAAGASSMRLVVTETGVETPSAAWPNEQAQADGTLLAYEGLSGVSSKLVVPDESHLDAVLFFESVEVGRGFGWLTQNSTGALAPRPVYCLMADRLGTRPSSCPGKELFADPVAKAPKKKAKKKPKKTAKKKPKKKTAVRPGHDTATLKSKPIVYSLGKRAVT